jgi:hypothetical protein
MGSKYTYLQPPLTKPERTKIRVDSQHSTNLEELALYKMAGRREDGARGAEEPVKGRRCLGNRKKEKQKDLTKKQWGLRLRR